MANRRVDSAAAGAGDGDPWSDAYTTLAAATAASSNADTIWVAPAHNASQASAKTIACPTTPGLRILGVDSNTTDPATTMNGSTAAIEAVGAANAALTITGCAYIERLQILGGTNANTSCVIGIGNSSAVGSALYLKSCVIDLRGTNASMLILGVAVSNASDEITTVLDSCTLKFGATSSRIDCRSGRHRMTNLTIDSAGATPVTLLRGSTDANGSLLIEDSDLSGESYTNLVDVAWPATYEVDIRRTKIPSGVALTTGTHTGPGGVNIRLHRVSSGDTEWGYAEAGYTGSLVEDTGITRTGGGAVSIALDTNANVKFPYLPLVLKGSIKAAAGSRTLTLHMVTDRASALTDADVALRVHHQGNSGSTQGVVVSSAAADVFATPATLTSGGATWGGTGGFTNAQKREIKVSFTAAEDGYVEWELCVFTDLTNPLYVDPQVNLS